jgi:SAM-dependent methyltransferase
MGDDRSGRRMYDTTYGGFRDDLYAAIRREAFGEEIGQNSWLTADEQRHFFDLMEIDASSEVLEVASGSGGPALFMATETGCRVTGLELHADGVTAATSTATERGLADRTRFVIGDARERLPFADASFDAVECIDSINHLPDRESVLAEFLRVLRPGGRLLFTNPITITGIVRRDDLVARSQGMGEFVFTAPGVDERLLGEAGFADIRVEDVTENTAHVASVWMQARRRHAAELAEIEGAQGFAEFQATLEVCARLAREHRLSRIVYLARKPAAS